MSYTLSIDPESTYGKILRWTGLNSGTTVRTKCEANIRKMFIYSTLYSLFTAVQITGVMDTYIYSLTGSNLAVGLSGSISGVAVVLAAWPMGVAIDKYNKTAMLRWSTIIGIPLQILFIIALNNQDLPFMYTMNAIIAVVAALQASAGYSLFTDSIPLGNRSHLLNVQFILQALANMGGPVVSLVLFQIVGDSWETSVLKMVMIISTALAMPSYLWLVNWQTVNADKDKDPLQHGGASVGSELMAVSSKNGKKNGESDMMGRPTTCADVEASPTSTVHSMAAVMKTGKQNGAANGSSSNGEPRLHEEHHEMAMDGSDSSLPGVAESPTATPARVMTEEEKRQMHWVPILASAGDIIVQVGSGITLRYFALFFYTVYGLSPVTVQLMYVVYGVCFIACAALIEWTCKKIGRVQATILFNLVAIGALFAMSELDNVWMMIILFEIRGAFANALLPIDKSIVMDYVESEERGKWNALGSIAGLSFSGSAMLGGYLADTHGYKYTFQITVAIYALALLFRIPLIWLVKKKE